MDMNKIVLTQDQSLILQLLGDLKLDGFRDELLNQLGSPNYTLA